MDFDLEQTDHLLTTTRAVRKRLDLDAAGAARADPRLRSHLDPGPGRRQPSAVALADGRRSRPQGGHRRCLPALVRAVHRVPAGSGRPTAGNASEKNGIIESSLHLADVLQDVPVLAIPCALGAPPSDYATGVAQGWWGSIIPTVWSYCLAARSRGLGTVWTTLHLGGGDDVADALGIPDSVTQLACIPTAFYTGDDFKPASRRPAEEITYWNRWKATG